MRNVWLVTLIDFHETQAPNAYYVEGYASPDLYTEPDIMHCWIDDSGEIIDYDTWAMQYVECARYSWQEIDSLIDLIEDNEYSQPLCLSYGKPRFTKSMVKFMQAVHTMRIARIKASIADSQDGQMYDKPIGPKRRVGRPKKYKWSDEVSSSNLEHIYYDLHREVMTVDFKSGATYEYYGVPLKRYKYLKRAKSKGKYFHKKIRFSYPYKRIRG